MATPTTISKQNKPAASKPMAHKANLTSQPHALEAGGLVFKALLGASGAVSCWGIELGVGAANELPDALHYKNLARPHSGGSVNMNTLSIKMDCSSSKIMLQNLSTQAILGLDREDHAILVAVLAATGQSSGAAGLGLGLGWAGLGLDGLVIPQSGGCSGASDGKNHTYGHGSRGFWIQ
jgi:hypothetical protein